MHKQLIGSSQENKLKNFGPINFKNLTYKLPKEGLQRKGDKGGFFGSPICVGGGKIFFF